MASHTRMGSNENEGLSVNAAATNLTMRYHSAFYLRKTLHFKYMYTSLNIALILLSFVVVATQFFSHIVWIWKFEYFFFFIEENYTKKMKNKPEKMFDACAALFFSNI